MPIVGDMNTNTNTKTKTGHAAAPIALALLVLAVSAAAAAPPAKLVVEVSGFRDDNGQVLLRLYGSEAGFPTDGSRALRQLAQPIKDGRAVVELTGLPFGSYAIGCIHDENGNGKLDTNFLGIPREGVCASNDARGHRGPPRWSDARFDFRADGTRLQIHVRY
jgi:uncharacterized protein (DUF2141 family)